MMNVSLRIVLVAALLAPAGCFLPSQEGVLMGSIALLADEDPDTRQKAFLELSRGGPAAVPLLKRTVPIGAEYGLPAVALLYATGGRDAVPLDLAARHLASFRWPVASEHALLEPYVWNALERDLVRAGAPAQPLLARTLARHAVSEEKAIRIVRLMLRIGGLAAAREFAGLLGTKRDLGGVRVCDVAAAALLYEGLQDLPLRLVDRDERLAAARTFWKEVGHHRRKSWWERSLGALAERWTPEDPEGLRPVFELLAGEAVEDPKAWMKALPTRVVGGAPWDPVKHVHRLSGPRPQAFFANRHLEDQAGLRLYVPPMRTLGDLCAALRLWKAPPSLELRWRRHFEGPLLRVSMTVVGHHPELDRNHVLFVKEKFFHASEDATAELTLSMTRRSYFLYVQLREQGTRMIVSEYASTEAGDRGYTREASTVRPWTELSALLQACVIVSVDTVPGRLRPRPQNVFYAETRARLRKLAGRTEGYERSRALHGLGYLQNPGDLELFRKHGAGEALLLQGDPEGLKHDPKLRSYEIEMALRRTTDDALRAALEDMKKASGP